MNHRNLFALAYLGPYVGLLALESETLDALLAHIQTPTIEPPISKLAKLCTLHRIADPHPDIMLPGAQRDMIKSTLGLSHPLVIGERGREFWGEPIAVPSAVDSTTFGLRFVFRFDDLVVTTTEWDEADLRYLSLVTSPTRELPLRFRELSSIAPELAFTALQSRSLAPSHLPDGQMELPLVEHLRISDLVPLLDAAAEGVQRPKKGWRVRASAPPEHPDVGKRCPRCERGALIIKHTRRGRYFLGCDQYPDCDQSVWLADQEPSESIALPEQPAGS